MKTLCIRLSGLITLILLALLLVSVGTASASRDDGTCWTERELCETWIVVAMVGYGDGYGGKSFGANREHLLKRLPTAKARELYSDVYAAGYYKGETSGYPPFSAGWNGVVWDLTAPQCTKYLP
jgi:hypothetical protein